MGRSQIGQIKQAFFNHSFTRETQVSFKEPDFELGQLHNEFSSLYQLAQSNRKRWIDAMEVVLYTSYICDLMILYYELAHLPSEVIKLKKQKKEIESFIKEHLSLQQSSSSSKAPFPMFLLEKIHTNLEEYQSNFDTLMSLRQKVGDLNTNRSKFGYSRALAMQILAYLQNSPLFELIQEMNEVLGNQYGFVDGISLLNESRETLAVLGVVLFAFRFIINLIIAMKQVIQAALHNELSCSKVLEQELEKRGFTMASDLVWSIVGLLTTYPNFFHIATTAVSPIILVFLVFDAVLLAIQWLFEATKHKARLNELIEQKENATALELTVIQRQLDLLDDEWDAQCSYYAINIFGAHILALSFAVTLLYTGPLALAGVALFSMLGNALYNTAEEYKKYQQTKVAIKRELANGVLVNDAHHQKLIQILYEEHNEANKEFWNTLAFNFGGIAFIITTAVIFWPVALTVTIGYIGYQLSKSYQKQLHLNNSEEIPHDLYRFLNTIPDDSESSALTITI